MALGVPHARARDGDGRAAAVADPFADDDQRAAAAVVMRVLVRVVNLTARPFQQRVGREPAEAAVGAQVRLLHEILSVVP